MSSTASALAVFIRSITLLSVAILSMNTGAECTAAARICRPIVIYADMFRLIVDEVIRTLMMRNSYL